MRKVVFTAHRQAALLEVPDKDEPANPDHVHGRTVISLTSPGTELNWGYLGKNFPVEPGYACVFEVESTGSNVTDLPPGTLVFCSGNHQERQSHPRNSVIPLPPGLKPEAAVFARLAGVSMTTLNTTAARPPSRVLVTGLGPVGNLAAQVFTACGYLVTAVDPVDSRRRAALDAGLADVRSSIEDGPADLVNRIALHLECSGHEKAVLDGCKCVRKRGEVVLVGVPWQRRTDIYSFELLHAIFHRYIVVRSGWEWEIPHHPADFAAGSISENYSAALAWLAAGKLNVAGLASAYSPVRAQEVYEGLLSQSFPTPTALFDWRLL